MTSAPVADKPTRPRSTVRDLLTVMSGTAGAQAIGLLILPILARTFAPEAFGVFQLYLSLLIFATVAVALRIELTLLSKPDDEAHHTVASLFGLVLATSVVVATALSIYGLVGPGIGFPAVFLGLGLAGNGFAQVASYKLIRDQSFSRLAAVKVSQVLVYAVVALTIAAARPTLWGLITADVVGRIAGGALALSFVRSGQPEGQPGARFRNLAQFVRRHWEMAVISLPGALANSGGAMLTPFMVFHVFGAAAAGQYGLVDRAMGVPVAMVVNAGSQVFAGRITAQIREGNRAGVRKVVLRIVLATAVISGTGAAIAYLLIPTAFRIIFGAGWDQAIAIARILIFSYAVALVSGIVNQTLVSLSAFRLQSAWDICWPIFIGTAWIAVVTLHLNLYTAVALHAATVCTLGVAFVILCLFKLRGASSAGFQGV
ncbi:conserved membrane hypothetical protein [Sphingomonas sp. EC-HK361]|uniref:lipopolysaccharide biosynthesis protein n=1 Tax=Sphingomonas sp. EC-HK361 TaxID=2038397 RepID=UPI00125750CD|nr:oligosaccharide flippase family protein [Sphingomonas sp. EC-HK361]VVS98450.1 conserved membrane hypothetical protein [Sphingomonas sp. EC-HK361]